MPNSISESDWKLFRNLHAGALERLCQKVIEQIQATAASSQSYHERYSAIYALVKDRDKQIAEAFNDLRRSTALMQLAILRAQDLVTESELDAFSSETQQFLNFFREGQ